MSVNATHANDNGEPEDTPPGGGKSAESSQFKLSLADCIEAMASISDRSIQLILADLPYGTTACSWDSVIDLEKLWAEYERIITPTGVIVLTAAQPFTTILAASKLGWLKESLVWEKSRATGFLQSKKRHLKKHEDILVFSPGTVVSGKGRQTARNMTYNPQGLVELEKPVRSRNGNMKGGTLSDTGGHNTLSPIYRPCYVKPNTKRNGEAVTFNGKPITGDGRNQTHTNYPTSILRYASERKTVHPTQKPVALMEYLVRTYSNDGDTVLDNVMGSGTTGVACANVGNRHFIGIERDPDYFTGAEARIAAAHGQAPEAPLVPVAANDDAHAIGPDGPDEIVARVQAIMAAPKRRKAAKAPAWKLRQEARRQDRKVARRIMRNAGYAEQHGLEELAVQSVAVPAAPVLDTVAPVVPECREPANENAVATSVTLHQGDCLEVLRTLKDIDLAVTSPPYCNVGMEYGDSFKNIEAYVEFSRQWIKATADALKPTGACWINVGMARPSAFERVPLTYHLYPILADCGLTMIQEVIWDRRVSQFTKKRFSTQTERWMFCVKDVSSYTFNGEALRDRSLNRTSHDPRDRAEGKKPTDLWDFCQVQGNSKERNAHPCQFPEAMIERIVLACSNPGEAVLDPFGGSGTTGAAAIKHGRNAVLIERDAGYCAVINARLGAANCQVVAAANENIPPASLDREAVTFPSDRAVAVPPTLRAANDAPARVADDEEGEGATAVPAPTPPECHQIVNPNGSATSVTFYQGDCLQTMRGMADGSVDVIVTSPPYNLGTSTGNGFRYGKSGGKWKNAALQNGYASYSDDMPDEAYVEWLKAVISECWRLIPDDGAIFFNHKPRVQGGVCLLPTRFLPPEVILRQEIIWARSGGMNFNQSFFLPTHERVLVLAKPKFRLKKGASGIGDVWTIPHERKNEHPAPFPLELPRRCIAATNAKVIFDPFTGSGTTGVAAQLEGRDFVGCELDPGYLEMARQRLGVQAAVGATGAESAANDHEAEVVALKAAA